MTTEGTDVRPTRLGKYELITRIGQGGMAEVQLAIQRGPAGFEKLVVVKLVHENLATQKAFVDMLLDEARVAALVKHPNVVDIYDLGEVDGRFFIAMEYLEGEPLLSVLRAGREGKRLDVMSTTRLIADTAEGLEAAHELRTMGGEPLQLVHHDVSLGNIVVLYNGQVKLVDFGVAKATQTAAQDRRVQGKFSYMAPEKLKGAAGDRRSDIWSLGVVLWEALTLKRLFRGGNDSDTMRQVLDMPLQAPSETNGDVPAELDPIVMRSLARDPDQRYATAKELATDLEGVLTAKRYGARNDLIARYMQDAFKEHIVARKKLLHEVSSKGTASDEILDQAFSDPLIATGSGPGQNDFSVRFRAGRGEEASQPAIARSSAEIAASRTTPPPMRAVTGPPAIDPDGGVPAFDLAEAAAAIEAAETAGITGTGRLSVPSLPALGKTTRQTPVPPVTASITAESPLIITSPKLEPKKPRTEPRLSIVTALPPRQSRTRVAAAILLVVAAGALVAWWVLTHDGGAARTEPSAPPHPVLTEPPMPPGAQHAATAPIPPAPAATAPSGSAAPPTAMTESEAEPIYHEAMHLLDTGDTAKAVAALKRAELADPAFAPSYRALGLAFEKLNDKPNEKLQLVKYLKLAPSAADAARIRDKVAGL